MYYRLLIVSLIFSSISCQAMLLEDQSLFVNENVEDVPLFLSIEDDDSCSLIRVFERRGSARENSLLPKGFKISFARNKGCYQIREIRVNEVKKEVVIITCQNLFKNCCDGWKKMYQGIECDCVISER